MFVHIPKTAGTTISECLEINNKNNCLSLPKRKNRPSKYNFKHALCEDMCTELEEESKLYKKFAVVRNPWDLVVSLYFHLRKPLESQGKQLKPSYICPVQASQDACEMSFKEWTMLYYNPWNRPRQKESSRISPGPVNHFLRQMEWITSTNGDILVDKVLRFENPDGWKEWFQSIEIDPSILSNKKNTSARDRNYRIYYDDETAELISKYYSVDIETFKYQF